MSEHEGLHALMGYVDSLEYTFGELDKQDDDATLTLPIRWFLGLNKHLARLYKEIEAPKSN